MPSGKAEPNQDKEKYRSGAAPSRATIVLNLVSKTVSGTNPEELIGAAHAGCYSMALSVALDQAGYTPDSVRTEAHVHLVKEGEGFTIDKIDLVTEAQVPNISKDDFQQQAKTAKENCPVSKALAGVDISLDAKLVS